MEEQFAEPFGRLTPEEAKAKIESGELRAIDVREGWEWANGHVPNAVHIPLAKILSNPRQHLTSDNVVFICEVGQRSEVAAEIAASIGLRNVYNLEGGTRAWRQRGLPIER